MKKQIQFLLILIAAVSVFAHGSKASPLASPATTAASRPTSWTPAENPETETVIARTQDGAITSLSPPIFGIGKPKFKKKRIQRQNTVDKINRRTKSINRKNGIGMLPVLKSEEVSRG